MKKAVCICFLLLLFRMAAPLPAYGEEILETDSVSALWEESGAPELMEDSGLAGELEKQGITVSDPQSLAEFSMGDFLRSVGEEFTRALSRPFRTAGLLGGIILLSAFAGALQGSRNAGLSRIYDILCTLCAVLSAAHPVSDAFAYAARTLESGADFMLRFSAVFSAVLAVSGGVTAAASYQAAMVLLCQIAMQLSAHFLIPLLSMVLGLSIVDAVNPEISLEGIIRLTHKCTIWILGLFMALFLGMLSVQSMVAVSADRFGTKTTKFVISNFVPFVGSAVSDAYTTVLGSLQILRSATGMLGILSLLVLLLPMLLELMLYRLMLAAAAAVSEMFGTKALSRLFKNLESVFAAALSIAVSFSVMFIVSAAVMVLMGSSLSA